PGRAANATIWSGTGVPCEGTTMITDTAAWTTPRGTDAPSARTVAVVPVDLRSSSLRRRPRIALAALLAMIATLCAVNAGWIHAKAALAQALLERSWSRTADDGAAHRPW